MSPEWGTLRLRPIFSRRHGPVVAGVAGPAASVQKVAKGVFLLLRLTILFGKNVEEWE